MRKRIVIHNTFDAAPNPKRPTWESVQPEIRRIMASIKNDPTNIALKRDLERVLSPFAIRASRVSPNGHDAVGTPEEIAYGWGYNARRTDPNPYSDTVQKAAFERGRAKAKLNEKFKKGYFAAESRSSRFVPPKPRDAHDSWMPATVVGAYRIFEGSGIDSGKWAVRWGIGEEERFRSRSSAMEFVQEQGRAQKDRSLTRERGHVARVFVNGTEVAKSEPFITERSAQRWAQEKLEKLAQEGRRAVARVFPVFYDPAYSMDNR